MGQHRTRLKLKLIAAAAATVWLPTAWALQPFKITDIRAEGLQRLELGTVLTYLPLSVGDEINDVTSRQAMRALYGSGLFQDVSLESDGTALVIRVKERPAISTFKIEGNDKVGGDELNKSLTNIGLADGELFKRETLDQVQQELQRQYFANGYYDVQINTEVVEEPNNRISLKIKVVEGKVTKIKSINILGNKAFTKEELLEQFKLERSDWQPFQKTDRYSKQQLGGDIEALTSYYQDRGYLKFSVASVQVQLSPTKEDIYITINIEEGDVYKIKDRRFSGETILNSEFLIQFLSTKPGDTFSRKLATESADRIEAALSDIGYAFAKVTPVPEVDEANKEVSLNYYVEPGKRAYVRRINFSGHAGTNDETLRREMRQLEAAPFSKSSVERSRVRLARLPFVEEAEVDTAPVPGTDDLVDINYKIKERPPGSVQFGVGYSGSQGFLLSGSLTHSNFLGTGNRVAVNLNNSSIYKQIDVSWTDPYFTNDGISQTISTFYRKSSSLIRNASSFSTNTIGANLTYGIPLSEFTSLRAGLGVEETSLDTSQNSSDQILEFVTEAGSRFTSYEARTGIGRDTRNRTVFASRGSLHQLNLDINLPGSDLEYANLSYRAQQYIPLPFKFFLEINGNASVIKSYGDQDTVPPYEHFFAGGARTVRGYDDGSLGPRDTPFLNPFGGQLRTTAQTELVIPTPFETDNKSTRISLFFDIGQVYAKPEDFETSELRQGAGIAFQWFTPFLGLLDMSYGYALNPKAGDETDRFQITFGSGF